MKTTTEWLMRELTDYGSRAPTTFQSIFDIAKEMEKEQIIKANRDGVDMVTNKENFISGEEYYKQKYEKLTTKDKALELFNTFRIIMFPIIDNKNTYHGESLFSNDMAKMCAIKSVEAIIKQLKPIEEAPNNKETFIWWEEVIKEINKL